MKCIHVTLQELFPAFLSVLQTKRLTDIRLPDQVSVMVAALVPEMLCNTTEDTCGVHEMCIKETQNNAHKIL